MTHHLQNSFKYASKETGRRSRKTSSRSRCRFLRDPPGPWRPGSTRCHSRSARRMRGEDQHPDVNQQVRVHAAAVCKTVASVNTTCLTAADQASFRTTRSAPLGRCALLTGCPPRYYGGYRMSSSEQRRLQKVTGIGMALWRAGIGMRGSWRVARRSSFAVWQQQSRRLSAVTGRRVRRSVPAAGRRGRSGGRTPRSCGQPLRAARWCLRLA